MPASYVDKEFSVCDSELQDVVGVYTGADGKSASLLALLLSGATS